MALIKRVHCLADVEPAAYHTEAGLCAHAVNLNLECVAAADFQQTAMPAAREAFVAFLEAVGSVRFHLYDVTIDPAQGGAAMLTRRFRVGSGVNTGRVASEPPLGSAPLVAWLDESHSKDDGRYWLTAPPTTTAPTTTSIAQTVDESVIGATHEVRSAHGWNAPVAHRFSLTHLLRLPIDVEPHRARFSVVLPSFDNPPPQPPADPMPAVTSVVVLTENGSVVALEATYDTGIPKLGEIVCRTTPLSAPQPPPGLLTDGGFFTVDAESDKVRRLLQWFEARALTLTSPVLGLARTSTDKKVGPLFDPVWSVTPVKDKDSIYQVDAPAAAWRAVAGLCAALDGLVIGLLRPSEDAETAPEGQLLSVLVSKILIAFDGLPKKVVSTIDPAHRAAAVKAGARAFLRGSKLFDAEPGKLVDALRSIHALDERAAQSSAAALLLDKLLKCFVLGAQSISPTEAKILATQVGKESAVGFSPDVLVATAACETRLHDVDAFKDAIQSFFESAVVPPSDKSTAIATLVAPQLADHIAKAAKIPASDDLTKAVSAAWQAFKDILAQTFNGRFDGAEAVRRSACSALLIELLGRGGKFPLQSSPGDETALVDLIDAGCDFSANLFGTGAGCFGAILKQLPRPPLPAAIRANALFPPFQAILEDAHRDAMVPLHGQVNDLPRFLPDHVPAPLAMQIADSLSVDDVAAFAAQFNGIAVAARRIDAVDSAFGHLNLASLTWSRTGTPTQDERAAIHPLTPAAVDGRAALFVDYQGYPFASPAFGKTVPYASAPASQRRPFYTFDVAPIAGGGDFVPAPGLAYGRMFETLSFATTNAGTLPKALQVSSDLPWRPSISIDVNALAPNERTACLHSAPYQRRTAIGRIGLEEGRSNARSWRIGAPIADVWPLANDYPHLALASATSTAPGALELLRLADGSGGLSFPSSGDGSDVTRLRLADPEWLGGKGTLNVALLGPAPSATQPIAQLEIPGLGDTLVGASDIELYLVTTDAALPGGSQTHALTIAGAGPPAQIQVPGPLDAESRFWIRLTVTPEAGVPVGLSFAEPETPGGTGHGIRDVPLLVLAPKTAAWTSRLKEDASATITAPKTGYLDFERWVTNPDLRTGTLGGKNKDFLDALLTASLFRHLDQAIARDLDTLPDPSVCALRLTLILTDQLGAAATSSIIQKEISLAGRLATIASGVGPNSIGTIKDLKCKIFEPLRRAFEFNLRVIADTLRLDVFSNTIEVGVPEGCVAQFSIAPLVEKRHFKVSRTPGVEFPAVFHPGMEQLTVATDAERFVFPETLMRIETMTDAFFPGADEVERSNDARKVTDAMIHVSAGSARRYDLRTKDKVTRANRSAWRLVAEVDITTQRWRPMGRPAYQHIEPRKLRTDGNDSTSPAIPLADAGAALDEFEREIFFDRLEIDSETTTQRLTPLPAATTLQTVAWDSASATYLRHRFSLRSRYAGALMEERRRTVSAWVSKPGASEPQKEWSLRVAMLADRSRLVPTRPQLRGLIPLTSAPGAASAPPILAILQEPPFAQAGLADRVAAELSTGFGYGFKNNTLQILDSRKEVGPSPSLTFRALDEQDALGLTIRGEGPFGLTFDEPNGPAPAFPNSMMTLTPMSVADHTTPPLEEHFLGVSLRRYIDPYWAIGGPTAEGSAATNQCWWIELPPSALTASGFAFGLQDPAGHTQPLLSIETVATLRQIKIVRSILDPRGPAGSPPIVVAQFGAEAIAALVLLHQPLATGHATTTILGFPQASVDVRAGRSSMPLVLASFEWSPAEAAHADFLLNGASAWPAMASAPTSLAWARSGLDHEMARALPLDRQTARLATIAAERMPFSKLRMHIEQGLLSFRRSDQDHADAVWLCSSTLAASAFPAQVHRHLAVITTRFAEGAGRPVEKFCSAELVGALDNKVAVQSDPRATSGRVVEFETPAMVLTDRNAAGVPATYRSAYFDLVGTGCGKNERIDLFIRFVGPPDHLKRFATLKLTIQAPIGVSTASPQSPSLTITLPKADDFALAAKVSFDGTGPTLLGGDGRWTSPIGPGLIWASDVEGLVVTIETTLKLGAAAAEFWADASLLHSTKPLGSFDFDWLFSRLTDDQPSEAVRASALAKMTEVQARLIAMSPSMPLSWA